MTEHKPDTEFTDRPKRARAEPQVPALVVVRFLVYDGPYQAGQIVEFPAATAAKLVERSRVAEYAERRG